MECEPPAISDMITARAHREALLDQALEDSFPASDPIEIARID